MSRTGLSDEKWAEVRENWASTYQVVANVLEMTQRKFKLKTRGYKDVQLALKITRTQSTLILEMIDELHEMDKAIHKNS